MVSIMGLCLFLLLSTYVLAESNAKVIDGAAESLCPLATRFRNFRKYTYQYTAESTNGVPGTADTSNGPRISCKVEFEVPQTCKFVLRTTECALSEVTGIDAQGQPVYTSAPGTEAFKTTMERNPLNFVVEQMVKVSIYPGRDEPENIVNIKKGIISALLVPATEGERNSIMSTIHGRCPTNLTTVSGNSGTVITAFMDLSTCSHFHPYPHNLPSSPLSLPLKLDGILTKFIRSTQTCTYHFDSGRKHMAESQCTEKHIFNPFSDESQYVMSSEVKQTLVLRESVKINNRFFSTDGTLKKTFFQEEMEDIPFIENKEDTVTLMKTLSDLPRSGRNQERARLFHKLVSHIRRMKNETLSLAVEEMIKISKWLTWQALLQCGTSECTSAILQILRGIDEPAWEVDGVTYALSLLPQSSPQRIRDILSMAQHRQSKPIMYALANTVKKFPIDQAINLPEVKEVAEFMEFMLGDCLGDEDKTFLTLRVIGVMGKYMEGFPSLKSTLLSCMQQQSVSLSVQKSAIHAFRLMKLDSDVTNALLQQYQSNQAPTQKRIAAYLMLMRSPDLVKEVAKTLKDEKDLQVMSFIVSHMKNLLDTEDPNLQIAKVDIKKALESVEDLSPKDFTKFSNNYKLNVPKTGSVEGNVIFDSSYMPREVTLATTLDIFNLELLEIGLEGEGLESIIEALFGENGFFPDTISKTMYWAKDQVPPQIRKVLEKWIAPLKNSRMKRESSQNILEQIKDNFEKFRQGLKLLKDNKDAPKLMAFLQLLGTELGYMKTSELTDILENMIKYKNIFFNDILLQHLQKLLSTTDNDIFAHYMFLDEAFTLPTGSGFPLKLSFAGIVAPGTSGGLNFKHGMLSFKPSMGVEFVTQMGIYFPKFIDSGIRMHTNIYHESDLDAKITISPNQVKLSIPVTKENTQLLSISNDLFSITSTTAKKVSPNDVDKIDSTQCSPILPGMRICTILHYYSPKSAHSPYYPLTGGSRFAMELQPTGDVSEYTATVSYELLKEGKEGRHKVDSLVASLKAEGATPTMATATLKYNRNKKIFTGDLQIPDMDIEAGINLAIMDNTGKAKKMHGITIDVSNRKSLQLSLVGRVRLESMEDGTLEIAMAVPALQLDASITASLKKVNGLVLQLETAFKVLEASSQQKAVLRYDENKIELELKSDMNSDLRKLIPEIESYYMQLQMLTDNMLDQKVAKTDMKLRHIVSKGIEAANIWLDKLGRDIPYLRTLRSKTYLQELPFPSIPEKLYFKSDALFRYQFNKDKIFFSLPLPFGGRTSAELKIPSKFTLPAVYKPYLGLDIPKTTYRIPSFTIPKTLDFSLPLIGMGEVSAKINSNFYDWEGSIQGGKYTDDVPSYIAKYKVLATGPVTPLSYKLEGTALLSGTLDDHIKYIVNGSLNHSFLDASFSVMESKTSSDKYRTISSFEVTSPFGLETSLYYSSQLSRTDHLLKMTADANVNGVFKIGPLYSTTTYTHWYTIDGLRDEGKGESVLKFESPVIRSQTVTKGEYRNNELTIVSKTSANQNTLKHIAEVKYKNGQLSMKTDASVAAQAKDVRIQTDLRMTKKEASLKFETHCNDAENQAYSVLMASLNDKGLEVNLDGTLNMDHSHGTHKGTLTLGVNGLATSCTTTLQCRSVTFENVLNAGIDGTNGASMSLMTKASGQDNTVEFNAQGTISKAGVSLNSIFKGNAFDGDARNTMNMDLNKQGLSFSNSMTGTLKKMKTESTHSLTVNLWTLAFRSKTDNLICDGASYNHEIEVNMRPFVTSVQSNCKIEMFDIAFKNDGSLKLEPLKLEATGSITGKYKEDTLKTTCGINFSDLSGSIKCGSTGNVLESQISQNIELEFAGLSSVFKGETNVNSRALKLENVIRTMAMPFSLTVDGILNVDGTLNWYGKHTGQLYSKLLFKAEPFAIAKAHDWRASATHMLPSGYSAETHIENKFDSLLTPNEQSILWKFKSKLNKHAYNQDFSIYNKEADMGVHLSSVLHTDLLSEVSSENSLESQEFSISGILKYDKNSDCHIIDLPFIESLPVAFEKMKTTAVNILESLQQYLNGLDINDLVRQFRENLEKVPKNVRYFMEEFDIENKLNIAKDKVISLAQDYAITLDDVEEFLEKLKIASEKALIDFATKVQGIRSQIKDYIETESWTEILDKIGTELKIFDKTYGITDTILKVINAFEDVISQIDLQKLQDGSVTWLRNLDAKYDIRAKLQTKLSELKQVIETFDITNFIQEVINYISSLDLNQYVNQLSDHIPAEEIKNVIESIKDVIVNWIEEYEVVEKINYVYSKVAELFQKYEIEKMLEIFIEQSTSLIQQFKILNTVEAIVQNLKSIPFEYFSDKIIEFLNATVNKLKSVDIKKNVDDLNNYILMIIRNLKTFDYNIFITETNKNINNVIKEINEQIMLHEIPQKIEAFRDFLKEMHASTVMHLERLKNTKLSEFYRMIKSVIDRTFYNDIKLKIQDNLEDMRQRIHDMDIRNEILVYLERASESYNNILAYISSKLRNFFEIIRKVDGEKQILTQIQEVLEKVLNHLKMLQIKIPDFTIPFTTLHVPPFDINLRRLQDISIPSVITIPEFTVLDYMQIESVDIDFEKIKQRLIEFIDQIREFKMPELDPEATFGDLRALYWYYLPDFTFPDIKAVEIKLPKIHIPKLDLENFEITMLPIPEVKLPHIPIVPCVPAFGKLYGKFALKSPHYIITTEAVIQNTTTKNLEPQFQATLSSVVSSTLEVLDHSLNAMLQIKAPKMKKMVISETIQASHMAFTINHEGSLIFSGPSAEATAKTVAKASTQVYNAELTNNVGIVLKNGISVTTATTYNHDLNLPSMKLSSQATFTKNAAARFESGTITVTCRNEGNGKWSIMDYADEGIHRSNLAFNVNAGTAKLTFDGETNSKILKAKQSVSSESVILSHIIIDVKAEAETPFMKSSVMTLTGKAQMEGLKIELTASHNAELTGTVSGTLSNSCEFLAQPFEITLDCKNKGNSKIALPLKLTGKIDLKQDYKMILNSEKQHVFWQGLTRFNQYKYNHNFTLDNNKNDAGIYVSTDGEANLDFLTVPITVPEMSLSWFETKSPTIKDFSLWEDFGLKHLLITPHQSFNIDFKLQYQKNLDKHSLNLNLGPIYQSINENAKFLGVQFERGRDIVSDALTNSYNQARAQIEKFNNDKFSQPPRYFTVPGYTIPLLNIKVSAFRAELPAVSYFIPKEVSTPSFKVPMMGFSVPSYTLVLPSLELPVLYVPETFRKLTLPTFTLPDIQNNILIPAVGNLTYEFSFKSPMITVNSNGGLYNQSDFVLKLGASSSSVFDYLKGKIDGTTSITRKNCLKVATTLSLEHKSVVCSHDSSVSLTTRSIEAFLANTVKINLPVFTMDFNQQLRGNTKTKPNVASNVKTEYTYTLPLKTEGKGNMQHDLMLDAPLSYFSVDSSLRGRTDGTLLGKGKFSESIDSDAKISLNTNGLHFTAKTALASDVSYRKDKIWNVAMTENLEFKASLRRIYGSVDYINNNEVNIASFSTQGKHIAQGTIEFVPLTTLSANLNIDITQPSSLGLASMMENMDFTVTSGKQKFVWNSKQQLGSVKHSSDMLVSNDESEIRTEIAESVEAYFAFLKYIQVPIYQKSLWDVMKFDETTSTEKLQSFNVATHLVYTKSMNGILFSLPAKVFENGVIFNIPQTTLTLPEWMNPALQVPSFTLDLQDLKIPDSISVDSFDIALPGLPMITVPSFEINTKYLKDKMAFLLLRIPQYEVTISSFTLPKSFTIGGHTIRLDHLIKAICNFEIPTITIPEQKIEIPEISLHLPASIFIPSFGALATSVKVSSPIYNNTLTAKVENKEPGFVYTLKSSCISTMTFLEYDLEAIASVLLDDGTMSLDGKCIFSHNDVKVNWKHDLHQSLRIKREEPSATRPLRHTLDIDVTSQTFADAKFRYASHNNGITSSISYPTGFVGFQLTRKSPSQYYAKLFTRSLSSPDKDTDLLSFKIILKNSKKLNLQTSWQNDAFFDMVNGIKVRLPGIKAALYEFVNKYHKAHFGIDLNHATLKWENAIANSIDSAYNEVPRTLDAIQSSLEQLSHQSKAMIKRTMKRMPEINFQDVSSQAAKNIKELLQHYESNAMVLLDAVMKFLSETKFQLPGWEEKLTGQELYYKIMQSVSTAIKRAANRFTGLMGTIVDTVANIVSEINFTLPTTNTVINGKDILRHIKSVVKSTQIRIVQAMKKWEGMKLENLLQNISDFVKLCIQRTGEFVTSLKVEKLQELSNHLKGIYTEASKTPAMQELGRKIQEVKTNAADFRHKSQLMVQEIYNEISLENLHSKISELFLDLENYLSADIEHVIEFSKSALQYTQPYLKVTSKKVDLEIPLPFYWNSFSELPSMT